MRLVEVKITISRKCLVICEGFKPHILYFLFEYRREIRCLQEEVFEAALDESSRRLVAALFRKKRRKNDCQIVCCRLALARGVDYYDFYWLKKVVVNQDRTCALS